ncbi:uncharacterized protein LOC118507101 [Anopheles stephensi]|uniref:uncharacterized protein LOC118507101 n=1 Tax=Anopheles stephensi TaxID=30069 RepID=UPI001658B968|nr:uncharacterized protein LOC118507101 [Anopheles stephensi]
MADLNRAKWKCLIFVAVALICSSEGKNILEVISVLDEDKVEAITADVAAEKRGEFKHPHRLQTFTSLTTRDNKAAYFHVFNSTARLVSDLQSVAWKDNQPVGSRLKRHAEATDADAPTGQPNAREDPIVAEKQIMHAPHKSSEFQAKIIREESDSDGQESIHLIQEGIKSRAPRVNFVTQQTKNILPSSEFRDSSNDKLIRELYRKPVKNLNYERYLPRTYDSFMATSQSPMYPRVYNRYDSFHYDMLNRMHPPAPHRYDHYYERRHDVESDSYFPRYKFPYYYYYPDRRYDVPLYYRDRNYLYTNDIEQSPHGIPVYNTLPLPTSMIRSSVPAMRNRRIIYFATLPEIVRPRPKDNLNHRLVQGNRYEPYNAGVSQSGIAYKDARPVKYDGKGDKYVSSKPIKIVREAIEAQTRTSLLRDSQDKRERQQQQQQPNSWSNIKESNRSPFVENNSFLERRRLFLH